jgi:hypothetical protein
MERHCSTIDNKGGGKGVRERILLGGRESRGETPNYILSI